MGVNHGPNPQPQVEESVPATESDNTAANGFYFPKHLHWGLRALFWFLLNSCDNIRKANFLSQVMSLQSLYEVMLAKAASDRQFE